MFSRSVVLCVLFVSVCVTISNACKPCICQSYRTELAQCSFHTVDQVLPQIPDTLPANTTELVMNNQPLKSLEAHTFTKVKLSLLQIIKLEYSSIKSIDKNAFNGVYNLSRISLRNNEIASLDPNVFATNRNLSEVELGYNKLTIIPNGLFSNLSLLKSVDLQNNLIQYVEEYAFYNNPELFKIGLQYNKLQMIEASMVDRLKALTHLLIESNDWVCHCGLGKLRDLMDKRYLYYRSKPSCSGPLSVRFRTWDTLKSTDFVCWLKVVQNEWDTNKTTYDKQVQLDCSFDAQPNVHAINWTYHGNEILLDKAKYSIANYYDKVSKKNKTYLYIKEVTPADSGAYTCTGTNYAGSVNRTYYLTVIIGQPPRTTVLAESIIEVDEGTKNFTLPCKVFGIPKPDLSWKTSHGDVRADSTHIMSKGDAEQDHYWYNLTFTRIDQSSGTNYTCTGINSKGSDAKTVQIIVEYLPTLSVVFELSDDKKWATVTCSVQAYPAPKIKWQRNKVDINTQSSEKYSTVTIQNPRKTNTIISVLQINNLLPSDIGVYQCIAENSLGSNFYNSYLRYTHVPIIVLPKDNTVHVAQKNDELTTIECLGTGSPTDVYWIRDGKVLQKEPGKYLLIGDSGQESWSNLTIFNIDESDTGQYQCIAKNYLGFATKTVILKITGLASETNVVIWIIVILIIIIALAAFFIKRYYKRPSRCTLAQEEEIKKSEEDHLNRNDENQMQDRTLPLNQSLNSDEESNTTCINQVPSS